MPKTYQVNQLLVPFKGTVRPPGSKSITTRALIVAALAEGQTELTGVLDSRDTQVMIESLNRLGIKVDHDPDTLFHRFEGCGGKIPGQGSIALAGKQWYQYPFSDRTLLGRAGGISAGR